MQPLLIRPQAPRPAAPAPTESAESQPNELEVWAQPQTQLTILGGAVSVGVHIILPEPPQRTPLLQLEDWLR
ncbi:hypothetical protein GCM10027048_08800 [Hymenobacter coalescens]